MKKITTLIFWISAFATAQNHTYWQQHATYKMNVAVDVKTYLYKGQQELVYKNNSPDTLKKVYYHLYNNAFQPNSEMDARLQSIKDPDKRMTSEVKNGDITTRESRIKNLKPDEIGFLNVSNFKQDGKSAITKTLETVLEVTLHKPILPHSKTVFTLDFEGQVPLQIRRSGRNNAEGVALSMAQWYPKIAEFDFEGWHADPYIAREFHGVWADFDVKITIDKNYILGGSGYLQNGNEIGFNYQDEGVTVAIPAKQKTLTWHFIAPNVHDFAWGADPNYIHDKIKGPNQVDLHFLYKNNPKYIENWKNLQPKTAALMDFYNKTVGNYPYKQYSVIQGGDGGMEYAMCTLILGNGTFDGLLGVTAHEMAHSWFQHVLATNESKHPWMDEGFTSFLEDFGLNEIAEKKTDNPFKSSYDAYFYLVKSGKEQPLSTHSDRYDENRTYSINSYAKGALFLSQLQYLIGKENLVKSLQRYYADFKFKHPTPNDVKRSAERVTGANLDWFLTDWTQTTNTIDYGIKEVKSSNSKTQITLERIGRMPMPTEIAVETLDGKSKSYYVPLRMMHYTKQTSDANSVVLKDWAWAYPTYTFEIDMPFESIKKVTLDPTGFTADVDLKNNVFAKE
jgi:hypothetical protein